MTSSWWYALKCRIAWKVARLLPDHIKRCVLYLLVDRVEARVKPKLRADGVEFNIWGVTFSDIYQELKDK